MSDASPPPPPHDDEDFYDPGFGNSITYSALLPKAPPSPSGGTPPDDFDDLDEDEDDILDVFQTMLPQTTAPPTFTPSTKATFLDPEKSPEKSPKAATFGGSFAQPNTIPPVVPPPPYLHPTSGAQLTPQDYALVQSLRYAHRQETRYPARGTQHTRTAPLLFSPDEGFDTSTDATALVYAYLEAKGFVRTADVLKREVVYRKSGFSGRIKSSAAPFLESAIRERLEKDALMFNDPQPWPSAPFMKTSFPLATAPKKSVGGSVDYLLEKLVCEFTTEVPFAHPLENTFTNVFLLTYSYFITPHGLFTKLTKMFKTVPMVVALVGDVKALLLMERIVTLILAWLDTASVDFPKALLERLLAFSVATTQRYSALGRKYDSLCRTSNIILMRAQESLGMGSRLDGVPRDFFPNLYREVFPQIPPRTDYVCDPPAHPEKVYVTTVSSLADVPPLELARQLCLLDQRYFRDIRIREFYSLAWSDPTLRLMANALSKFSQFTANMATWVSALIISPVKVEDRRNLYRRSIHIAGHLYDMQDYSSAQAFLNGLDACSIMRMTETIADLPEELTSKLAILREAFHPFRSVQRSLGLVLSTPCVPNVTPFLGDITRVEEYAESVFEGGVVNWSKMEQLGKVILRILSYQSLTYNHTPVPIIQNFLERMPGLCDPNDLYDLSRLREPQNSKQRSINAPMSPTHL